MNNRKRKGENTRKHLADVVTAYDNLDHLAPIDTYRSYSLNYTEAYFIYSNIANGSFAAGTWQIGASDWKQVTIRPSWTTLQSNQRQEVIAHEMGHCWGLGHGTNDSLMIAVGFIGKTNPQPDDINGIFALYGGS